ncbi:formin-like protein 7 [Heracleum sosnowskyi]|uniref:Formin-like protein 7 n=1 Tax=Heracleum sosnowskyi TaxID=360622 RepID=A0AAD8MXB5_9APIA|nr:formin-like protein 7 [Heracleum sosnowskyi]
MASGSSSGRVNIGSKRYELGRDDILSSFEDYPNPEASNGNHPGINANDPAKEFQKSRMANSPAFPASSYCPPEESFKQDLAATVESTVKKYADNLMRFLEGISSRLSQLELYCYNLEKSIGEMRSELARDNGEADSKLKFLEKHLQEVHRSVQILRDKQELSETQKELAKIQLTQKESSSSIHSQHSEERASPPVSGARKNDETSDMHGQLALALPSQVSSQPSHPTRPQGITPSQGYYLHSVQLSSIPSHQMQQTHGQYLSSDSQYRTPPLPTQTQVNQMPHNHSLTQYPQQWSQQVPQQGQLQQHISLQSQVRASPLAAYSSYMHGQAANPSTSETLPNGIQRKMSFSGISQPTSSHPEAISYGYLGVSRPVQQQPPHQHVKATFGAQPGDGYVTSGPLPTLSPRNSYVMYDGESGTTLHLPPSHIQQSNYSQNQQQPNATNPMVRPSQIMRNHPYSELFEKLVSMGYRGDQVVSVIQRLEQSGQPVDFNAVLDRLNALSSGSSQRAWSG